MELGGKELPRLSVDALILGTLPHMPLLPQVPADSSDFYAIRVSLKLLLSFYVCMFMCVCLFLMNYLKVSCRPYKTSSVKI